MTAVVRQTQPVSLNSYPIMAPLDVVQNADAKSLKRSFTAVTITTPPSPDRGKAGATLWPQAKISRQRVGGDPAQDLWNGEDKVSYSMMPSATGSKMYQNQVPSFMSSYDMDASLLETPNLVPSSTKLPSSQPHPHVRQHSTQLGNEPSKPQHPSHSHHESTSTQTSDSTDSSPTTTISTVDSSSLSDPSPSSSPESPITLVPLSSFSGTTFGIDSFQSLNMTDANPIRLHLNDERPMTSPLPRKPKNPKALALNLNPTADSFQPSEPSSPSFIKPPPLKARKKASLLSLNTGAANKLSLAVEPLGSPGVANMLQRRGLKHSISSPQILSTPGFGPAGGMTLGKPPGASRLKELNLSMNTFTIDEDSYDAPTGVQMATRVPGVSVGGDSFDRPPTGEDVKSPSYPDGPILMHEPNVHLYLEPKVEEAMKFDVVINVAREVKNPFTVMDEDRQAQNRLPASDSEPTSGDSHDYGVEPDTATTTTSFRTAFEVLPSSSTESSPTTPKPSIELKRPEYIHVPWDHNTDVKDELWDLCNLIESRTKEGKRVLVHCQQGASRSATLIIAYGMYVNQDLGATEAYAMAQAKSKWVNPNMSLLFSLNDFKKIIDNRKGDQCTTIRKPPTKHRPSLSADTLDPPPTPSRLRGNSTPNSAARDKAISRQDESPIPTQSAIDRLGSFDFGFGETVSRQLREPERADQTPSVIDVGFSPPPPLRQAPPPPPPASNEPVHVVNHGYPKDVGYEWEDLLSPRLTEMTTNPIQTFTRGFGSTEDAEPPTPSLFSPRAFEFPRLSFFPPPVVVQQAPLPADEDPRSPPTKGEAPITRSIDDLL